MFFYWLFNVCISWKCLFTHYFFIVFLHCFYLEIFHSNYICFRCFDCCSNEFACQKKRHSHTWLLPFCILKTCLVNLVQLNIKFNFLPTNSYAVNTKFCLFNFFVNKIFEHVEKDAIQSKAPDSYIWRVCKFKSTSGLCMKLPPTLTNRCLKQQKTV